MKFIIQQIAIIGILLKVAMAQKVVEVTVTENVDVQVTATVTVSPATTMVTDIGTSEKTNESGTSNDLAQTVEKKMLKRAATEVLQEGSCKLNRNMKCKVVRKGSTKK
jgi:hypothetical protein